MEESADEGQVFWYFPVYAPKEVYAEKFGCSSPDVKAIGFERWSYQFGMFAWERRLTCAGVKGTVETTSGIGESATSVLSLHIEQARCEAFSFRTNERS